MAVASLPQFYMDEKWKLSKKEGSRRSSSTTSTSTSTSASTSPFIRNSSSSSSSSSSPSQKRNSFSRRCASLVKQQRARIYIIRRCVTMLICWHDCADS